MTATSLRQLAGSLPMPADSVRASLLLSKTRPDGRRRVQTLARRGYLGCLPFVSTGSDDVVFRLLPDLEITDCPIAIAWQSMIDGLTIAPRLKHFVAGRLAQIDYCSSDAPDDAKREILEYAGRLGGEQSARAVMAACTEELKSLPTPARMGTLWAAAKRFDPLFAALGGAWMFQGDETARWLKSARGRLRSHPIVVRVRVSYHTHFKTGTDVAEDAWEVVFGDHVFDATYTGITRGASLGSRKLNALVYAVRYLREKRPNDVRFQSRQWAAAEAAVDDPHYDGSDHLRIGLELRSSNPISAYTHLANAAAYAGRANRGISPDVIEAALNLARKQQWSRLSEILSMTFT